MDGQAFDDVPCKSGGRNFTVSVGDLIARPDRAVRHGMQRTHNTLRARLRNLIQGDRVKFTKINAMFLAFIQSLA